MAHLEHSFPYWFCLNYAKWVGRDAEIPVDGNLLLSLIAPRPLYVGSAVGDEWSDPKGEFLSAVSASSVYRLLGKPALSADAQQPSLDHAIGLEGFVAYHERTGKHDDRRSTGSNYLDFLGNRWGRPAGHARRFHRVGKAEPPLPPAPRDDGAGERVAA